MFSRLIKGAYFPAPMLRKLEINERGSNLCVLNALATLIDG